MRRVILELNNDVGIFNDLHDFRRRISQDDHTIRRTPQHIEHLFPVLFHCPCLRIQIAQHLILVTGGIMKKLSYQYRQRILPDAGIEDADHARRFA